jgi:small subunit ribosomal protein S1
LLTTYYFLLSILAFNNAPRLVVPAAAPSSEDKSEAKPKAKSAKTKEAAQLPDDGAAAGTTNLGALLKAKMDSKK